MDHINSFFSKLVKSIGSSDEKYIIIIAVLKESIGFEIDKKNIVYFSVFIIFNILTEI